MTEPAKPGPSSEQIEGKRVGLRRPHRSTFVAICIGCICLAIYVWASSHVRSKGKLYFEPWAVFHYYIGAKYLNEIDYFDIYSCALDADREGNRLWGDKVLVRDMRSYALLHPAELSSCPRERFSSARWKEFVSDIRWLTDGYKGARLRRVMTDKGFNPPPSWAVPMGALANAVPLESGIALNLLFNLDLLVFVLSVAVIWYCFGGLAAMASALMIFLCFGNFGRLGGNYMQYVWFFPLTLSLSTWQARKPGTSGAALGLAAGLQAFPALFAIPVGLLTLGDLARRRWLDAKGGLSFLLFFTLVLGLMAGVGCQSKWGGEGWERWQSKISTHGQYLKGEIFDIGLANLVSTYVGDARSDAGSYRTDFAKTQVRLKALEEYQWAYILLAALSLAFWLRSFKHMPRSAAFAYGLLPMYVFLCMSPFYYVCLGLVPLMFWKSSRALRKFSLWWVILLYLLHIPILFRGYVSFEYLPHLLSESVLAIFFVALPLYASRLARREGLGEASGAEGAGYGRLAW